MPYNLRHLSRGFNKDNVEVLSQIWIEFGGGRKSDMEDKYSSFYILLQEILLIPMASVTLFPPITLTPFPITISLHSF